MINYPVSSREKERLSLLNDLHVVDTGPDEILDRITAVVRTMLGTNIACVSLLTEARQWFKSRQGLDAEETPREWAFCNHTVLDDDVFEVVDAHSNPLFADNPLVTGEPNIRYYAGAPVVVRGHRIGALCAIDSVSRAPLSPEERDVLKNLALIASHQIELVATLRATTAFLAETLSSLGNQGA